MVDLSGQNILITGGAGSIGSEILRQVLETDAAVVRVLDADEGALFDLKERMDEEERVRYLIGDVRNRDRLSMAMEDIDVVFHAAGLKHVGLNEYNPFEAVQTNVQGTQNLIRAALDEEIESFVTISTDKASNPVSVMGATKLLSERLVIAANTYKGSRDTRFGCVRFGNVLGTSGSVVPTFMNQIRDGGPVTVTDPDMTRFVLPIEEAVELVLMAHQRMTSGEVFVLKMKALRIGDLAEAMIERYASGFGYHPDEIDVEIIGARPAERVHEKLISSEESLHVKELDRLYAILPQIDIPGYDSVNYSDAEPVDGEYTSADQDLLSKSQIVRMIERAPPSPPAVRERPRNHG
jgi:FlaA1/EpsC-like NDP-sugar epimerase